MNITCAAVGSPMPHVIWRREGDDDLDPDKQDTPFGENVLVLNNVQENTNYTCIATSVFGKIEANVQVKRVET